MLRATLRLFALFFVQILAITSLAEAQGGLSEAVLEVSSTVGDSRRNVDGQLYEGRIVATISDRDGDPRNFTGNDRINFAIGPRGQAATLRFSGEAPEFEAWARENASALLAILFPGSLSASVLGRGAGELQAQQVLLTTALAMESVREMSQGGRSIAGGMFEYETFTRDGHRPGDSARAWQGLYNVSKTFSLQGRYVETHEGFATNASAFSADYHPFVEIDGPIRWRVGGTARGGLLYLAVERDGPRVVRVRRRRIRVGVQGSRTRPHRRRHGAARDRRATCRPRSLMRWMASRFLPMRSTREPSCMTSLMARRPASTCRLARL